MSKDFPTIVNQAKGITYVYKLIGLYSIVLLTVVTVVSMTNVFTSGEFAQFPGIRNTWAFIFALAIDVNIVRLFVEGKLEKSKLAYGIGTGLAIVTGAALFIEGLQQSIGLQWGNEKVQIIITFLVGFRVLFVIVLMAREGTKLGNVLLHSHTDSSIKPDADLAENLEETSPEIEQKTIPVETPSSEVIPASIDTDAVKLFMTFEEASRYTGYAESTLKKQASLGQIRLNKKGDKLVVSSLKIKMNTIELPEVKVDTIPATNGHTS